jgi:hypothetical protein
MALLMERLGFDLKFDVANVSWHDRTTTCCPTSSAVARRHNDLDLQLYVRVRPAADARRELRDAPAGPGDDKPLPILRFRRQRAEQEIRLPGASAPRRGSGWLLIDGRPVDAAPCGSGRRDPTRPGASSAATRRWHPQPAQPTAGVVGTPGCHRTPRAELFAFDRKAGLRAQRTIEVVRADPRRSQPGCLRR